MGSNPVHPLILDNLVQNYVGLRFNNQTNYDVKTMKDNALFLVLFATFGSLSILFLIASLLRFLTNQNKKQIRKWDKIANKHVITYNPCKNSLSPEAEKEIRTLMELRNDGVMTLKEFEEQKSKVISKSKNK